MLTQRFLSPPPHQRLVALAVPAHTDFEWVEIVPDMHPVSDKLSFALGQRGCTLLLVDGYSFVRNRRGGYKTYWICSKKVVLLQVVYTHTRSNLSGWCFFSFAGQRQMQSSCDHRYPKRRTGARLDVDEPQPSGQEDAWIAINQRCQNRREHHTVSNFKRL